MREAAAARALYAVLRGVQDTWDEDRLEESVGACASATLGLYGTRPSDSRGFGGCPHTSFNRNRVLIEACCVLVVVQAR